MRYFLLTLFLVFACNKQPQRIAEGPQITHADYDAVAQCINEADFVIVGDLKFLDSTWYACSGSIVTTRAKLEFHALQFLWGAAEWDDVEIWQPIMKHPFYLECAPDKGFRLSPTFFVKGSKYIVIGKKMEMNLGEGPRYYTVGPSAIWISTPENISSIKDILAIKGTLKP